MDTITEAPRSLEQVLVFAGSIYKGSQRFVRTLSETLSQLSPDQIKRGALVAGLTVESLIITEVTPYKGNPILEAFVHHPPAQVHDYEPPPDQIKFVESKESLDNIPEEIKKFANNEQRIRNTLRWKNLMEQIVADKRLGIPESKRAYWADHMLKIIFIESGGNPTASSGIAFGLTQLKSSTAAEMAAKFQIKEYDVYKNAWDNAFLGTAYQLHLANWYGPELAAWAHHLGLGNMNIALQAYLASTLKLPVSEVSDLFNDSNKLSQTINQYNITPQALLSSPAVTAKLKSIGAWGDLTWEYYPRYLAAGKTMNLES